MLGQVNLLQQKGGRMATLTKAECRYRCGSPITHFCSHCNQGDGAYYCETHAKRHDRNVRDIAGTNAFAQPLSALSDSVKPKGAGTGEVGEVSGFPE